MGHMRNDIKRSEAILDRLSLGGESLTEAGKEWVIAAFDPFHDRDINCTGYPDTSSQNSMLQVKTLTMQISCPSTITTGTWDCHIVDYPFLGPCGNTKPVIQTYTAIDTAGNNVTLNAFQEGAASPNIGPFGGLVAYSFPTSNGNDSPFTGTASAVQGLSLTNADLKNPYRVIGKGFEVYNTTPDLYKSGAVCVYSQPVPDYTKSATATIYGTNHSSALSVNLCPAPPASASEALQLSSSRQWDAREGCYVISRLNSCEISDHLGNWTQPMYYSTAPNDVTMYGSQALGTPISILATTPAFSLTTWPDQNWTQFDQDGAIFTGLSIQSTLTVNFRQFIEVFPSTNDSLANYAKPSPMYDHAALELYARIAHKAPIGVEVKFNGLGDWFIDGINAVKDMVAPIAAPMLKAMKHPAAKALGTYLGQKKKVGSHAPGEKINGKLVMGPQTKAQAKASGKKGGKKKK